MSLSVFFLALNLPATATIDLSFITPPKDIIDVVKEPFLPEIKNYVTLAIAGIGGSILIRSITGGR